MKKEKKAIFEERVFDNAAVAQSIIAECETKLERNKIGIIVSLCVPVIDVIGALILSTIDGGEEGLFTVWFIAAIVAYLLGGGLVSALKLVWNVTWTAYALIPIFPADLLVGAAAFCITGGAALFLPIIFVLLARRQITMDKEAAERYLTSCYPVDATAENASSQELGQTD